MGRRSVKVAFASFLFAVGLALAACGGASSREDAALPPTASPEPAATATQAPVAADIQPDGQRILKDVQDLATGPRPSGSNVEREVAERLAARLRSLGYEVTLQQFPVGTEMGRSSKLGILSPTVRTIPTLPLANSATASVQGKLVAARLGRPADFPPEAKGAVVLIERGEIEFTQKVRNAAEAGAIGVVIYNNEPGMFLGTLTSATLPAVSISQEEGQALVAALAGGPMTVEVAVGPVGDATSQNVIAKPPGRECETISGGHYDTVPGAPGASDNASGTATVLEIAAVLAKRGEMGANCFVLFGAEELGLLGSRHFVNSLDVAARSRIKAMLNFDMVGVGDQAWWLIGTDSLKRRMDQLAETLQIDAEPSELIRGLSSDHASFMEAGIPAIMFHRWEDNLLHTPQDVASRVKPEYLEDAARMGVALLESLETGG